MSDQQGQEKQQQRQDLRPLRHCMVVQAYYPAGETRVQREARALVSRGHAVDVIALRLPSQPPVERVDGVTVYRVPARRRVSAPLFVQFTEYTSFFLQACLKLSVLHLKRRYDVVQVHNLPDLLVLAAFVPKLTGARVILDLHDLMPEFYAARFGSSANGWGVRLVTLQERLSCRFADHVITVTEPWRQLLIRRRVPAHKVSVVMNVADDAVFHRSAGGERVSHNGCFNLIYHGNFSRRYGLDLAIRALSLIRDRIPEIHLLLHGGGEVEQELEALAHQLGVEEHVTFSTKCIPTPQLPSLIRQGDAGVVPYRNDVFTDGILPTKLMEYVAMGVPVIAARTRGIQYYFDDDMVEFFTPGDAQDLARCMVTLYQDRERRGRLAERAERFKRRYDWNEIGSEYVTLVERLGYRPIP